MSRIKKMILELCPNGVKYKKLKDICKIETGKLNANAAVEDGEFNFYTTAKEISKIDRYRWDTEALLIAGNANVGDVKYYNGKFEAYQRTYVLTEFIDDVNVKFLYHILSNNLKKYLNSNKNEAAMTYIVLKTLEDFKIPIPPIEVQNEIVRILDVFSDSTVNGLEKMLITELELREKQYQFYLNKSFTTTIGEKYKLGDIVSFNRGKRVVKKDLAEEQSSNLYPVYQNGLSPLGYFEQTNFEADKTIIISAGAAGEIGFVEEKIWAADDCFRCKCKSTILDKYLYYYLKNNEKYIKSMVRRASVPRISKEVFEKMEITVPSIEEQIRVVDLFDRFEKIINNVNDGLPAEIELRRKQYEYYRNKLLSFEELSVSE